MGEEKVIKEFYPYLKIIEYKSNEVLFLDFSNLMPEQVLEYVPKAREVIDTFPRDNSLLMITDFTKIRYNKESLESAKLFAKGNEPFIKKSAILGITGLLNVAAKAMITFSGRENIYPFQSKEEALEWLIK